MRSILLCVSIENICVRRDKIHFRRYKCDVKCTYDKIHLRHFSYDVKCHGHGLWA